MDTIKTWRDAEGAAHIRVDTPGERAVSARIEAPLALIRDIANDAGLEIDDSVPDAITLSWPAGS